MKSHLLAGLLSLGVLLVGCDKAPPSANPPIAAMETSDPKIADLTKRADSGDAQSQYELGNHFWPPWNASPRWFAPGTTQSEIDKLTKADEEANANSTAGAEAIEWYQKAAAQGHAGAQFKLGEMYLYGHGVRRDKAKAVEWYQKSAAKGNADAQYQLGYLAMSISDEGLIPTPMQLDENRAKGVQWYQKAAAQGHAGAQERLGWIFNNGFAVAKDSAKAFDWYQKAAAQGNADAQAGLGGMYANGEGVSQDVPQAAAWYLRAASQGQATAQFKLGEMYSNGTGVQKDSPRAVEWWQKAAAQGNADARYALAARGYADAQFQLGKMYLNGSDGFPEDLAKAVEWYQKAAAQGNADAQYALGDYYRSYDYYNRDRTAAPNPGLFYPDFGDPIAAAKAVEWFQKAARQGHTRAQLNLGQMYFYGWGLSKDAPKAAEWYQQAALQGNAEAQLALGRMYYNGQGVIKSGATAVDWWQKAAAQGNAPAQLALGWMYDNGEAVPKDVAKAAEWYQKAAAQGDASGQLALGIYYSEGKGVPQDPVLAYAWWNLVGTGGDKTAEAGRGARDIVAHGMSSAQIAEAQRLSSSWKQGQTLVREGRLASAGSASSATAGSLTKKGTGTLFLVSSSGQAITNDHVVAGCSEVRVDGREGVAKVMTEDGVNDLALVQVPGEVKASATIASEPGKLRQGEDIVVFGFPLSTVLSTGGNVTPGIVSALTGLGNNTNQIQITAPIQPGSSGSSVLNKKGEVVGVVSMKLSDSAMAKATGQVGQNVNFAINGQTLRTFLDAHQVSYRSGAGFFSRDKSMADLADEARTWTLVAECWK